MKRLVLIFFFLTVIIASAVYPDPGLSKSTASAQTPTDAAVASPSAVPTSDLIEKLKQIEALKEKIATKVAQLRQNQKGAFTGQVKSIRDNSVILTTRLGEKTFSYSDDTTFYQFGSDGRTETNAKKINTGETVTALGYFDSSQSALSAKYVYLEKPLKQIIGKIADVDKSNFTVTVKEININDLIDIETYSKLAYYSKEKGSQKGGFSKLTVGHIADIIAAPNSHEKDRYSALSFLDLAFVPVPTVTATPTTAPKTASPSALPARKK